MKKVLATIVLLTYLAISSGFVVSLHYCMDRFASAGIGLGNDDKCSKCGMHKDGNCCKDEVVMVKLETSHIASQANTPDFSIDPLPAGKTGFLLPPLENHTNANHFVSHSPPISRQDIYIDICVFRI